MSNCIPIINPPLAVRFKNALAQEELDSLIAMGASVSDAKKPEQILFSFSGERVDNDLLNHLVKHKKKVETMTPAPFGAVNLAAYQQIFKAMVILTWFCKTQSYPAFTGPVADNVEGGGSFDTIEGFITAKRKGLFGDRHTKRARLEEADDAAMDEESGEDENDPSGIEAYEFGNPTTRVPKAKPSTPPKEIYGGFSSLPTLPGNCFPYFPGMIENDANFVTNVIRDYFLESLGDTRDAIIAGHKAMKGSMGQVAFTETGRVIQHMFLGARLAIEAQARVFYFIDGQKYQGFALLGWYYTISIDSYIHSPHPYETLIKQVRLVDEHAVAVAMILARLEKMKIGEKSPTKKLLRDAKEDCMKDPRALAELIRKFDLDEQSDVEEIEKLATKLSFPQRFLPFTVENILYAVDLLVAKGFPAADRPLFTRGGALTTRDPLLSTMAMFGEVAFSFRTPGGSQWKLPADRQSDTKYKAYIGKNSKEVKPNPTVIFARKALGLCVDDWKAFLLDRTMLIKPSRDQAFRSIAFGGEQAKSLWYGIIDRVGPLETETLGNIRADEVALGDEAVGDVEDSFLDYL